MLEASTIFFPAPAAGVRPAGAPAIRQVDPVVEDDRWDAGLADCPSATFFHTAAWARVLEEAYGFRPAYFTLRAAGKLCAVLPVMEIDSWLTGRRGVSLPFTDECAPLCADPASFRRLLGEALDHARLRGWKYLEFRGGRPLFGSALASASFLGHQLDLRDPEAVLFSRLESSVRRAIRKAGQGGLAIEFSQGIAAVREFHSLLGKTRKRHGVPPQPFSFFAAIQRHILAQNQGWVVLARHGGIPVAGAVYFRFGKTVIYKYGASDEAFQHLRANNLVMWEAIKRHAQEGFATLDFGRTSLENEGLRRFKLGWGATERRIDYVRYDCRSGLFGVAADPSHGWHIRLFKLLPVRLLQWIGATLYKHAA